MALPERIQIDHVAEIGLPERPVRQGPVDLADAELGVHHYLEPEVNRLREWAMRANSEITEESMLNAQVTALPYGTAIALMVTVSLALWGLIAGAVALLF